jgi:hypothetical protein
MNRVSSIFSQLVKLIPRSLFDAAVKKHNAEFHSRGFSSWGQCVAMLFCQMGGAKSLREITGGLAAAEGRLRHLGLRDTPKRATLAYANTHRDWRVYETLFHSLSALYRGKRSARGKKFQFTNRLLSIDASVIPLWAKMFDGEKWKCAKGASKLHLVLDHDGYMPFYATVTEDSEAEITHARNMTFPPGSILVFDRGYVDYDWWLSLTRKKVYFVTRLKDNAAYGVITERALSPDHPYVIGDEVIVLDQQKKHGPAAMLRRIEVWVEEKNESMVFVTNHLDLDAATIAEIYKERWQIELFFKALKQSMRIKTFVGTSANAILTQIYTALIAILLFKFLQWSATHQWSFSNLIALLRQQLFVYRDLWSWLNDPLQIPPGLQDDPGEQLVFALVP